MVAKERKMRVKSKDSVWNRKKVSNWVSFPFLLEILTNPGEGKERNGIKLTHNSFWRLHCVLLETEPTRWCWGTPTKSVRKPQPRKVVLPGIRQLVAVGAKTHMHTFSLPSIICMFCIICIIHSFRNKYWEPPLCPELWSWGKANRTYQKCAMINDGLSEHYLDLETQGKHEQNHLSLFIIHCTFHRSQKRCKWWVCDEKQGVAISADHLWLPALLAPKLQRGTFLGSK